MVGCKQFRGLLESIEDNFLFQVLPRPTRGEVLLDLVLANTEGSLQGIRSEAL